MTSKFKEALNDWGGDYYLRGDTQHTDKIIRQALLIADRLESGEVSEAMYNAHCDMLSSSKPNWIREQFKAMAKVMIGELENEGR